MSMSMGPEPMSGAAGDPIDDDRSLGGLLGDLTRDLGSLVRQEMALAKTEVKEEATKAGKAAGMLGATAVAAHMALLLLSFALAWGLAEIMPTGFAFLIVGLIYAVVAYVLYSKGRKELEKIKPVPEQTVETLKEDAQWAKQQMK